LLSELAFGSLLTYSPRGQSEVSRNSRRVCYGVKAGDPQTLRLVAQRLRENINRNHVLAPLFGATVTLVPMPRSTPLVQGALWPAQKICDALMQMGVAEQTNPLLERIRPVARSSHALPGERPGIQEHYASFIAHRRIDVSDGIVLVDDVVTKGSTAIAAASRIAEAYPEASIHLFAVIRTKGMVPDIERILDPTFGRVRRDGDEADRQP
jgi:hypothetical protein